MTGPRMPVALSLHLVAACTALCTFSGIVRSDAPADQYDLAIEVVTDRKTGLTWQRNVDGAARYDLAAGMTYCGQLQLDGSGWRLPGLKELLTLVDPTRYKPAIDPKAFPQTPADLFLSSSHDRRVINGGTWRVDFANGVTAVGSPTLPSRVRCVRTGGGT